jgi:hypothetical protein
VPRTPSERAATEAEEPAQARAQENPGQGVFFVPHRYRRLSAGFTGFGLIAFFEATAFAVHLQDVHVMG